MLANSKLWVLRVIYVKKIENISINGYLNGIAFLFLLHREFRIEQSREI